MLRRLAISCSFAGVWAGLLFAASQLHRYDLGLGHGICGPWGCAASAEALLGAHLLWGLVLGPVAAAIGLALKPRTGWRIGLGLCLVGIVAAAVIVLTGSVSWWIEGNPSKHLLHRGLFVLLSTPDLPAIPLILAGVIGMAASGVRRNEAVDANGPPGENHGSAIDAVTQPTPPP